MNEIVKYTRTRIGDRNSLDLLRECLRETTQTPVIEDVVRLIDNQLDSIAFDLLANPKYLKDIIQRWERSSVFRKKPHVIIEGHNHFLVFDINLKTHVETRHVTEVRTPFARETVERAPDSNKEPLNARFPMHPFEKTKEEWLRVGSGYRGTCVTCAGKKTFPCEQCGQKGSETVRCPKCGGSGWGKTWYSHWDTDASAFLDPKKKMNFNVGQTEGLAPCSRCNGGKYIEQICSNCSGKGYLVCKGCRGSGEQYHRHMISTGIEIDEINRIVPKEIPRKWVKQIKASEKVIIHDYLPGQVEDEATECNVYLQHVGITVIPAVSVHVKADGQDAEVIILNNQAFSKSSVFGYSPWMWLGIFVLFLAVFTAVGIPIYNYAHRPAPPPVFNIERPIPTPAPEKVVPTKEVERRKDRRHKPKGAKAEEVISPVMPVPTPPEETLDQYLRKTDAGVASSPTKSKKKKKKVKNPY